MGLHSCRTERAKSEGPAGHVLLTFLLNQTVGTRATHGRSERSSRVPGRGVEGANVSRWLVFFFFIYYFFLTDSEKPSLLCPDMWRKAARG